MVHGLLVKFGVRFFHILALAEMQDGLLVAFGFRQFHKPVVGNFGNLRFRFKTGRKIFFRAFYFLKTFQSPGAVNLFRKSNNPKKLRHLFVAFILSLLRVNLKPESRLRLSGICLTQRFLYIHTFYQPFIFCHFNRQVIVQPCRGKVLFQDCKAF